MPKINVQPGQDLRADPGGMAAALAAQREKLKAKKARKVEPKEDEYGPIVDKPVSEMSFAEAIAYKKRMRDQKAKQEAEKAAQAAV